MEPAVLDHPKHALQYNQHAHRRLLTKAEVLHITGLKNTSLYGLIKLNLFPAPIKLTPAGRRVAWDSRAVDAWIEERIAACQSDEAGK